MHKWMVSLALLGMGGLSWFWLAARSRPSSGTMMDSAPIDELQAFNDAIRRELDRLQAAVDQVAAWLQAG